MRRRKDTGLDALDYVACGIIVTLLGSFGHFGILKNGKIW